MQGHALRCAYRSLDDLQKLVVARTYGKRAGVCKPFDKMKVKEPREELHARSIQDIDGLLADDLRNKLINILKGVQKVKELREELRARSIQDIDGLLADDLRNKLINILKGVQHVLSLLVHEPEQSPSTLQLQKYTILSCEPYHLYAELPNILTGSLRDECEKILNAHTE